MVEKGSEERLHALDAVRATALLLGIVLHSTMSYVPGITAMGWPIADSAQSETLQVVFFVIHIFRMTTFFLIAGFFAHLLYHRRGLKEFLRNRRDRVLVPLIVWIGPLMLAVLATLAWAMQLNPDSNVGHMDSMVRVHTPLVSFSWIHLWFLYILLLLYPLVLVLRYFLARIDSSGFLRGQCDRLLQLMLRGRFAVSLLAVPIALMLWSVPDWLWWAGVPTPQYSLDPPLASLGIYFYVFTVGWVMHRQRALLEHIKHAWLDNLIVGVCATTLSLWILDGDTWINTARPGDTLAYALSYAIAMVNLSFALMGLGLKLLNQELPLVRYLSDASFWMYLWHVPVLMFWQCVFMMIEWPWPLEFSLILFLTALPLVITYDGFVRSTGLGAMLNGRRSPRIFLTKP